MARAKNTSRSEARRRTRAAIRAEQADLESTEEIEEEPAEQPQRKPLFKLPDVRADIRALPEIFRSRRLIWLPLLLLLVGFGLTMWLDTLPPEIASLATLYIQFFFIPPALFTFFIAGFIAPRASYLVGLIYGVIAGVMWAAIFLYSSANLTPDGSPPPAANTEPALLVVNVMLLGIVYGTLAAAFAAWYRDFLRGMQERGKQRRAEQEVKERERRRVERQEARKAAKRPT